MLSARIVTAISLMSVVTSLYYSGLNVLLNAQACSLIISSVSTMPRFDNLHNYVCYPYVYALFIEVIYTYLLYENSTHMFSICNSL
jgi:hypothetical protein